jgi:hypothetical protein
MKVLVVDESVSASFTVNMNLTALARGESARCMYGFLISLIRSSVRNNS